MPGNCWAYRASSLLAAGADIRVVEFGSADQLGHPPVRTAGEAVADAEIDVEVADLEVDDAIDVVLLLAEGNEVTDRPERGVIFEADPEILAQLAGEARGRHELDVAVVAETDVDD